MKLAKIFVVGLAASTVAGAAVAADLPSRRAPVVAPVAVALPSWTGFYVGLNAGYGWGAGGRAGLPTIDALPLGLVNWGLAGSQASGAYPSSVPTKLDGFLGGAQIGYNFQTGGLVLGVETDIQGSAIKRNGAAVGFSNNYFGFPLPVFGGSAKVSGGVDFLGTLRARVGYAVTPSLLVYATGGLAYGQTRLNYSGFSMHPVVGAANIIGGAVSSSKFSVGYTLGGGAEYALTSNWSIKGEYLYYDLGRQSASFGACAPPPIIAGACSVATASVRNNGHIVRAGLNYKFGGFGGPVVAKY